MPRPHRRRRRTAVIVAVVSGLAAFGATPSSGSAPHDNADRSATQPSSNASNADGRAASAPTTVTLVTGDRVHVGPGSPGHERITFAPGPGSASDAFRIIRRNDRTYVIPDAARPYLRQLDPALFDVTGLIAQGYDDRRRTTLPLLVQYASTARAEAARSPAGSTKVRTLESIRATAVRADKDEAATFWRAVSGGTKDTLRAGVRRIWLDAKVEASLDQSTTQIGAPAAWDEGLTGKGVTIAVVDTGVDETHPDLAGRVTAERNFSESSDVTDRAGHGTHVASIAAGTGAADGGTYRGVAPEAWLVSAKVLDDNGSGPMSAVIAGVEWAVEQGADVVNLSLGADDTPGTDPLEAALDRLTEEADTLFVVAAGNGWQEPSSVSSPATADAALAVGAVDRDDTLAGFSLIGPRKGDYAIKPEITAPGVGIVASRASDSEPREPVGDHYARMDGTSMASPHVAGAAALLRQQHPDWDADDVKARLMSTATPGGDNSVYEQGAGRLDVGRAATSPIRVDASKLEFGYLRWPHTDLAPITKALTYTNDSDRPVTLELEVVGDATKAVSLSATSLDLPAGGSAQVKVTAAVDDLDVGLYDGRIRATVSGSAPHVVTTPFGWYLEPERYDLTVRGIDRAGNPSQDCVVVSDVDDGDWAPDELFSCFDDGALTLRVPPGKYAASAVVTTPATDDRLLERALVVEPEFDVTPGDTATTVVLDARKAEPAGLTVDPRPRHRTAARTFEMSYVRLAEHEGVGGASDGVSVTEPNAERFYVTPTEKVTSGRFEYVTAARLEAPPLEIDVPSAPDLDVPTRFWNFGPRFDGTFEVPVVDAGSASPEDLADGRVDGALAVVELHDDLDPTEQAEAAGAAGARAVLFHRPGEPGRFTGWAGVTTVPMLSTTGAAARRLLALPEGTTAVLRAITPTPFVYDLMVPSTGRIPSDPSLVVPARQLAQVAFTAGTHTRPASIGETRSWISPLGNASGGWLLPYVDLPTSRTDHVQAGREQRWSQEVSVADAEGSRWGAFELERSYRPGERTVSRWNQPVVASGLPTRSGYHNVVRYGDELSISLTGFVDRPDRVAYPNFGEAYTLRVFDGDSLLGEFEDVAGSVGLPEGAGTYRVRFEATRDLPVWKYSRKVVSDWTFASHGTSDPERPEVLPLVFADADLPTADASSRVRTGVPVPITVRTWRQDGARGGGIESVRLERSFDGKTWTPVPLVPRGHHEYVTAVTFPRDRAGQAVDLRFDVRDRAGNRMRQTVVGAFGLAAAG